MFGIMCGFCGHVRIGRFSEHATPVPFHADQGVPKVFVLIMEMTPVQHIDSMGLHFLEDLIFSTRAKGIELLLANPTRKVWRGTDV